MSKKLTETAHYVSLYDCVVVSFIWLQYKPTRNLQEPVGYEEHSLYNCALINSY